MKLFVVAGENSGDLHGANLMKSLKKQRADIDFRFCGGDRMKKVAQGQILSIDQMNFMGFVEVLANLGKIKKNFQIVQEALLDFKPTALILIDYPGFNLRLAKFAKANGIKVFYYISPKVWAWKKSRIKKIKAYVDRLFVILPFEKKFFEQHQYEVDYVGNPIMDQIEDYKTRHPDPSNREKRVLALLPGSRLMEVKRILPVMLQAATKFKAHQVVVSAVSGLPAEIYDDARKAGYEIVLDDSYNVLHAAHIAAVTSGTATLETALFQVPQVVCYRANSLSIWLAKKLVKIKFISLVNLILDKAAVPELIQEDCEPQHLSELLFGLDSGALREQQLDDYRILQELVGKSGASDKTANLILAHV